MILYQQVQRIIYQCLSHYYKGLVVTFHPDKDRPIYVNKGYDDSYIFSNFESFENLNYLNVGHTSSLAYIFAN